jgi:hypothetical protein
LVVTAADGAKFPAVPFNVTIWPAGANPTTSNAEIARVTAISTDTFTITRAQESSSARTVIVGDQIAATITAKTLTDVESKPCCQVYSTAATALSTGTVLPFAAEDFDTDTIHDNSTNNTRLTCNTAGKYHVYASIQINREIGTSIGGYIYLNNTTKKLEGVESQVGDYLTGMVKIEGVIDLAVNDYIEVYAYVNTANCTAKYQGFMSSNRGVMAGMYMI